MVSRTAANEQTRQRVHTDMIAQPKPSSLAQLTCDVGGIGVPVGIAVEFQVAYRRFGFRVEGKREFLPSVCVAEQSSIASGWLPELVLLREGCRGFVR